MKVLTVVGARPQFVKVEPLGRAVREAGHQHVLVHTGQHWDGALSDVFFEEMRIPAPDLNLEVGSGPHGEQTGKMLARIEDVLEAERPDWVVVVGDTNSTLAGALAAAKLHLPIAHVEAGLRSFNRRMPEEVNRVLTDHASDLLFAPTETAVANLRREGIDGDRVVLAGDVMYDAFLHFSALAAERGSDLLSSLGVGDLGFVLATIHRAENTDDPARLGALMEALRTVSREIPVILPLHPRTRGALERAGIDEASLAPLRITRPLGYLDMLTLESRAALVATDSGGVQKEAFFARVPCVTLRDETEWVELVELGWNHLLSPALPAAELAAGIRARIGTAGREAELYGGGHAARAIAARLG